MKFGILAPLTMLLLLTATLVSTACTPSDSRETSVAPDGPTLVLFYTEN